MDPTSKAPDSVELALKMPEILEKIFSFLATPDDLINVALVCRTWRDAAYHPTLWRGPRKLIAQLVLKPTDTTQLLPSLERRRIFQLRILGLRTHLRDLLPSLPSLKHLLFMTPNKEPSRIVPVDQDFLTDRTLQDAFQQRHTSLVGLVLCDASRITDDSVVLLASRLPNLTNLVLDNCRLMTDVGLVAVARDLTRLQTVLLDSGGFTDDGVAALAGQRPDVASGTVLLLHLDMSNCVLLTDRALRHISVGLTLLEELQLAGCVRITDAGLLHVYDMITLVFLNLDSCCRITDFAMQEMSKVVGLRQIPPNND